MDYRDMAGNTAQQEGARWAGRRCIDRGILQKKIYLTKARGMVDFPCHTLTVTRQAKYFPAIRRSSADSSDDAGEHCY